jgi:hypothetical protein
MNIIQKVKSPQAWFRAVGNHYGFGLLEVIIAGGVMGILMLSFAQMANSQNQELAMITAKLEAQNLAALMNTAMADASVCSFAMSQPPAGYTIDASSATTLQAVNLLIPALKITASASSMDLVWPGQVLSPQLTVNEVRLRNFATTGTADLYTAEFVVTFNSNTLIRTLKPIKILQFIQTDSATPLGSKKLVNCTVAPSGVVVPMYQCPFKGGGSCGGGAWGFYECFGQISSKSTCTTIEYPNTCSSACTFIGNMHLTN